jgi:hypothetical protein
MVTGDETRFTAVMLIQKPILRSGSQKHRPYPKKSRQVRSNVKVTLTVFFDCEDIIHHEFLPRGQTVNKEYYLKVMQRLREAMRRKRPDFWRGKK